MRPLKLVVSAFGPYAGQQEVNFDALGRNCIFLISGETGAGKTSIFDAISYALFGKASGNEREAKMFRSDFAQAKDKTYVELDFEYNNKIYHINRCPEYLRPKTKGVGMTKEAASADIILPDGIIVSGAQNVTEKVEEILGINRDQFAQIVMLAQGDFLKLLLSNHKDRLVILRKIFATDKYKNFQDELKTMTADYKRAFDEGQRGFLQLARDVIAHERYSSSEYINEWARASSFIRADKFMEHLNMLIQENGEFADSKNIELAALRKKNEELERNISAAENANNKLQKLADKNNELKNLNSQGDVFGQKEQMLKLATIAVNTVAPHENNYMQAAEANAQAEKLLSQTQGELALAKDELCLRQEKFLAEKEQEPLQNKFFVEIDTLTKQIPQYEKLSDLEKEFENKKVDFDTSTAELAKLKEKKEKLAEDKKTAENLVLQLAGSPIELEKSNRQMDSLNDKCHRMNKLEEEYNRLENAQINHLAMQEKYLEAEKNFSLANAEHKKAESLFLREQAGILAKALSDGAPCPVCGSTDHPNPAQISAEHISKTMVEELKIKAASADETYQLLARECAANNASISAAQTNIINGAVSLMEGITLENFKQMLLDNKLNTQTQISRLREVITKLTNDVNQLEICRKEGAALEENIQSTTTEMEEKNNTSQKLSVDIANLSAQIKGFRDNLEYENKTLAENSLKNKKDSLDALQKQFNQAKDAHEKALAALGSLEAVLSEREKSKLRLQEQMEQMQKRFMEKVAEGGFANADSYRLSIMKADEMQKLNDEIAEYKNLHTLATHDISALEEETKGMEFSDVEASVQLKKDFGIQIDNLQNLVFAVSGEKVRNMDVCHKMERLFKETEIAEARFKSYNQLSETANGELNGKTKISFEAYLQKHYFTHILNAANLRFSAMSSNRYELRRKEEAINIQSQTGLELEVFDNYTGKFRDVRSLSGGESFKASLALALGLSDIVQQTSGGIQLSAMFIDEGFGSLDAESLDTAIATLQNMAGENRIIGIISHVGELARQIDKQIIVKKSVSGSVIEVNGANV